MLVEDQVGHGGVEVVMRRVYRSLRLVQASDTSRKGLSVTVTVEPVASEVEEELVKRRVVRMLAVTKVRGVWSPKWRAKTVVD